MAMKSNKLTFVLVALSVGIVIYVCLARGSATRSEVASGVALHAAPQPASASASLPAARLEDADNLSESIKTVFTGNKELRESVQKVIEDNERLRRDNETLRVNEDAIANRVRAQLQADMANLRPAATAPSPAASAASSPLPGLDASVAAASKLVEGLGGGVPTGLGFDGKPNPVAVMTPSVPPSVLPPLTSDAALTHVIKPMGYDLTASKTDSNTGSNFERPLAALASAPKASDASLSELEPTFTIHENATLMGATAMTTLVGRVPIDGKVEDPMPFKLVLGSENLSASGLYLPEDVSGIIATGIAVGDMAMSCTRGWVQSLTYVFDDGTIRTVSLRGKGGSGGSAGSSLESTPKLGWLSDAVGNPCIPGQFVSNAPAYLTDVTGAKVLSALGSALSSAQTTTSTGVSALGSATSSTVTGNKGKFALGQAIGAGSEELTSWLTRRLNNSFDAVVVRAGAQLNVHIDQDIAIDKDPKGRKVDHRLAKGHLAQQQGARHGFD